MFGLGGFAFGGPREEVGTLALPASPPYQGYSVSDAFPGIGFDRPLAIVTPPSETNRLFVVEKYGMIWAITNLVAPSRTLFMDLSDRVDPAGEGGLLGLAFHPGFATNRSFFLFYTLTTATMQGTGFHNRLSRFEVDDADSNVGLPASEMPLITQFDRAENHNGGDLHFGPDGYLYISLGDEGKGADTLLNSQHIDRNFFSGILRIDVDRRPGSLAPNPHLASSSEYAVPPDNPFVGATNFNGLAVDPARVRSEFWAVGLRNPWRMSFDSATGHLYCGDVGQGTREEVDVIVRGGNYGWSYREGFLDFPSVPNPPPLPGVVFLDPILDYPRVGPAEYIGRSVTGGVVYRGSRLSQLYGDYVFGDYETGNIWALHYDGAAVTNFRYLTSGSGPAAFGTDPSNGDVLFAEIAAGRLRRLVYSGEPVGDPLPPTLADTGAFADVASLSPSPGVVAYEINVPFWSDHATKRRWFSVPDTNQHIGFSADGNWSFPTGTVWIKHFELLLTNGVPESARRLETRFLVRNDDGVYGITYRWDESQTQANLVPEAGLDEVFLVQDQGNIRTQVWHYPARSECRACHTPAAGFALGFGTAQLNREIPGEGFPTNQLLALSAAEYLSPSVTTVQGLPAMSSALDDSAPVEHRVRSYLAANCAQCHQPGGPALGRWDARFGIPLAGAGIVDGLLVDDHGNPSNRVIKPGSLSESMILERLGKLGPAHMPPLATSELNAEALALLSRWVTNDLVVLGLKPSRQTLTYTEGDGEVLVDPAAWVTAPFGSTWGGGELRAVIATNGLPEDRLSVRVGGAAPGQIGLVGGVVTFEGSPIGQMTGGTNGASPLSILFNTNAVTDAVQAVVRALTYENVSEGPSDLLRNLSLTLRNGLGDSSLPAWIDVQIVRRLTTPLLTWPKPADIVYGAALGTEQLNAASDTPGLFFYDPSAGSVPSAGSNQVLSVRFEPLDTTNFGPASATALISVLQAPLVVRADDQRRVVGQTNPPFTVSYAGFVNGDAEADLDQLPTLSSPADSASPPGDYPILVEGAADGNYAVSFVHGTLSVEPAAGFTDVGFAPNQTIRLAFQGVPMRSYRIEGSPDLRSWTLAGTAEADAEGAGEFRVKPDQPGMFFRLVWP